MSFVLLRRFMAACCLPVLLMNSGGGTRLLAGDPPPVRIAVISDADSRNLAALVGTELSARPGVTLVEREDLARLGDERKLEGLAGHDALALGKLVGADGLLFLVKIPAGSAARFTAVGLGYALFDDQLGAVTDPVQTARSLAGRVAGYAPKLKLEPAKAVPLSILNLRADHTTAQSAALERDLTLLLESRLAAVPEYVVLERRHAGALGFERSLDPEARPLLAGSYLVDGTLSLPPAGAGELTVQLRLVSSKDGPRTLEIRGETSDLPALVEKLTDAIRQATGHVPDPGVWQPEKEAREYLREALWARRHHVGEAAWEAADSAGLLGERSADLAALRVNLLLDRAGDGIVYPGGLPTGKRPVEGRSLDARTDDLLQAIAEGVRYANDGQEKKVALSNPRQNLDVRAYEMKKVSIRLGTELIACLDQVQSPRADEVRRALRPFTGYDPLHGKPGTHSPASPYLQPADYTDCWALTLEEALAWLQLSCTVPDGYVDPRLITGQGQGFCPRFLKTPEAQASALRKFVVHLQDDPAAQLAALVIKTGSPNSTDADAACRAYLEALWPMREALSANQPHRREWTDLGDIPEPVRQRQAGAMIPLLRYYLTHAATFEFGTFCIRPMWLPSEWSAPEAAAIWADYQGCKLRMEQERQKHGSNLSWLNHQAAELENPLLKKFPALAAVGKAPGASLVVTRFWHASLLPGSPPARFLIADASLADDRLFVVGSFREIDDAPTAVYGIAAPALETETIEMPVWTNAQSLEATARSIDVDYYAGGIGPDINRHRAGHYDRTTRTWTTSVVTPPNAEYRRVGSETFLHLPDALGQINSSTGETDLLISNRRKPPRNQLDSEQQGGTARVFMGPGNRPCVASQSGVFYVQAEPGNWTSVCETRFAPSSVTHHGQTMLVTWDGEAVLLDPARPEPEYLMAPVGGHNGKPASDEQKNGPATTTWQQRTYWDPPGQEGGSVEMHADRVAWYGERFFVLSQPASKSQSCELLVYTKEGGRKPRRVPLDLRLDEAARRSLAPIYKGGESSSWSFENIEHPGPSFFVLKPVADRLGLWLYSSAGGVWFIPYADLDDYFRNHAADPDKTTPPGGNGPETVDAKRS